MKMEEIENILKKVAEEAAALNAEAEKYKTLELQLAFREGARFAKERVLSSLHKETGL
jgi:hypothetical protein